MPLAFLIINVVAGVMLILALASIPLAVRGARQSYWWMQAGLALMLALLSGGIAYQEFSKIAYREVFRGEAAWWRFFVGYQIIWTLPVIIAGWCARAAVRRWPQSRGVSAVIGTLIGLCLAVAAGFAATRGMLPAVDFIEATM